MREGDTQSQSKRERERVNPEPQTSMSCSDMYIEYQSESMGLPCHPGPALIYNAHTVAQSVGPWRIKRDRLPDSLNIS